jgi:hypothetical protein
MNESKNTNMIETTGSLKKAWLVNFNGYSLVSTRRKPLAGIFGSVKYKSVWLLEKKVDVA